MEQIFSSLDELRNAILGFFPEGITDIKQLPFEEQSKAAIGVLATFPEGSQKSYFLEGCHPHQQGRDDVFFYITGADGDDMRLHIRPDWDDKLSLVASTTHHRPEGKGSLSFERHPYSFKELGTVESGLCLPYGDCGEGVVTLQFNVIKEVSGE